MATVAFIKNGRFYRVGKDGVFRDRDGVVYDPEQRMGDAPQGRVKKYEHISRQMPQWIPKTPDEKPPYPHVVETRPGSGRYHAAFESRREIEEFSARTGGKWSYGRGD